jgi:myo-inositol-1(or 4)-monophosphatase
MRMIGSIALSLCYVAAGNADAMLSLRVCRSIDAAAGQLIVTEAGGTVAFPDVADGELGAGLDLDMRSRVVAGTTPALFEIAAEAVRKVEA